MANKKFSEFVLKTSTSDVSHIVGYNSSNENVQITPANFVTGGGTGVFLPLAGGIMVGNTTHNDNVKSIYGTANDGLEIFHDGGNSFIRDLGTGNLLIDSNGAQLKLRVNTTESALIANSNSSVELYYNNAKKFETTTTGISVTGDGTFTGDVDIGADNGLGGKLSIQTTSYGILQDMRTLVAGGVNPYLSIFSSADGITIEENGSVYKSLMFKTGGATALTLDASQNATFAGSITSGAGDNFDPIIRAGRTASAPAYSFTGDLDTGMFNPNTSNTIAFATNGAEKMRLDASGNLGLGTSVIPSYWSGYVALQIGADNSIFGNSATSTGSALFIGQNIYNDGNVNRYTSTDEAGLIDLRNGVFKYLNAPSGLIGAEATLIERLTIDNTGDVGIGGTPNRKLHCYGQFAISNAADTGALLFITETTSNQIYSRAGNASSTALPLRFMMGGQEKMRLTSAGDLLVNTTSPVASAHQTIACTAGAGSKIPLALVVGITTDGYKAISLQNQTGEQGNIIVNTSSVAFNTSSDYRLKEDLQDFEGLDLVSKIPVYDYKWKADDSRSYGVMAHELEEVLPQAVTGDKDAEEMQSVDYSKIVPLLVKSIQELSAKLEALECQCEKK